MIRDLGEFCFWASFFCVGRVFLGARGIGIA